MVWPSTESSVLPAAALAIVCAATLIAGRSRKPPRFRCEVRRDLTSRSSSASPAHTCRKNSSRRSEGSSSAECSNSSTRFHRSASIAGPASHFPVKPGPSGAPVAHHSHRRHLEYFSCFLHAQAAKKTQLNHLRLSRIHVGKSLQSIVEHDQIFIATSAEDRCVFQSNVLDAAPAFQVVAPRVINQNSSHELRRHGEEMGAVLPAHALVIHQPQVSLVDQGSGLQTVASAFRPQVVPGEPAQFVIHDRCQLIEGILISVAPGAEQYAHVTVG